jgi:hypothetical protein
MLEREVASNFNTIFVEYGILAPIVNAQGGWPDRLIQLPNSRVVAAEIKSIQQLKSKELRLADFRNDQAAWLAKWQRNGGLCFLFIGITSFTDHFIGYGILTVTKWQDWINLPNKLLSADDIDFISNESNRIIDWFKAYTEQAYA